VREYPSIDISDVNNLTLNIYTIGYPIEGESILTVLCEKGKPIFTIVTDCYSDDKCHAINCLLASFGKPHIDVFIWTHPHDDHSKGIIKLLDKNDAMHTAKIFLPDGIMAGKLKKLLSVEVKSILKYLNKNYNHNCLYNINYVGVSDQESRTFQWILVQRNNGVNVKCNLSFIAPISAVEARRFHCDDTIFNLNDLSIVYSLNINDTNYIFGGDVRNQNVKFLNEGNLVNVQFIKIPHHSSIEPINFLKLLQKNGIKAAVATTTVYKRKNLPQDRMITGYKSVAYQIMTTGGNNGYRIGCIRYRTSIINAGNSEVRRIGNAKTL
jgi:hypothetical protein